MFCNRCGSWINDGDMFCPNCGAPAETPKQQPQPQAAYPQGQGQGQGQYGYPQNPAQYGNPQNQGRYGYTQNSGMNNTGYNPSGFTPAAMTDPLNDPRGMNWFKFIIYFALFAAAVVDLINAISYFTGSVYGTDPSYVYAFYPGLKAVDIIMGVLSLGHAAFCIYTRQQLAHFRKGSPTLIYIIYCINIGMMLIYLIALSSILGVSLFSVNPASLSSIVVSVVFFIINWIYFHNRNDLFKN